MKFEIWTRSGDVIQVTLGYAANVKIMDDLNFQNYRTGRRYNCVGGYYTESPVNIAAPLPGKWNVVIDLGGRAGKVSAAVRVISTVLA